MSVKPAVICLVKKCYVFIIVNLNFSQIFINHITDKSHNMLVSDLYMYAYTFAISKVYLEHSLSTFGLDVHAFQN